MLPLSRSMKPKNWERFHQRLTLIKDWSWCTTQGKLFTKLLALLWEKSLWWRPCNLCLETWKLIITYDDGFCWKYDLYNAGYWYIITRPAIRTYSPVICSLWTMINGSDQIELRSQYRHRLIQIDLTYHSQYPQYHRNIQNHLIRIVHFVNSQDVSVTLKCLFKLYLYT